ncbi:MAG: hypothetical protein M9921_14730 [Fimbriimonadaceae bacterium]|nr:hypothetical protein [Fimbriimonadaceae bacterium]
MSLLAAIVLLGPQGVQAGTSLRFMQPAVYRAGSVPDPLAAGGYGASDNAPKPMWDKRLLAEGPKATLTPGRDQLILTVTNGSKTDIWFHAADSNLLGYLEAKDARGVFRPIQYHQWYTCGNSYHRVGLPPGTGWTFSVMPSPGTFHSTVRWRYRHQGSDLVSNELRQSISLTAFDLDPGVSAHHELWLEGDYPVLGLKGIRRR